MPSPYQFIKPLQQLSNLCKAPLFPAEAIRLSNGLTLIHQYLPATPVVAVDVWVKAGANAEPQDWQGMAHFLEHMIFKGSEEVRPGEFDWIIETSGGGTNAATSHDYAHFFITTAAAYLPQTLPYFADILLHAAIPDQEFGREMDVVIEEIHGCHDDPDWLGFQALCETIYGQSPYGRSILGTADQVRQRSPHQMRCFHRTHYQPENMTVVMVGGMEREPAIALVSEAFCHFAVRSECPPVIADPKPQLTEITRSELRLPRLEQARLMLAWTGPGVDLMDVGIGLDMLSVILAGGRSSRLVRDLREEQQQVWDIGCEFSLQKSASLITINAWLEAEALPRVEAALQNHLTRLQTEPITAAELSRVQRLLCNDYAFSTETPAQLAGLYGYYNTIAQAELAITYPTRVQQMTPEILQHIAQDYLKPDCYAVTVMRSL